MNCLEQLSGYPIIIVSEYPDRKSRIRSSLCTHNHILIQVHIYKYIVQIHVHQGIRIEIKINSEFQIQITNANPVN